MSAFTYRPDPLDDMPARAAAVLPDMALLPMLARRIQVARRSGPLDPQLSFDIDKLIEGVDAALDLAEAGHESEAFDRSLAHLRQLAASIDARLGARFAAAAADLEMQAGVSVQDLGTAPQDATPAWAALTALPAPTTPGSIGDAVPPVILRTGFDDNDCGRVSGSFHILKNTYDAPPAAPIGSVVVPANTYLRLEPGTIFMIHATGWVYGGQNDYPKRDRPSAIHLLAGEDGALVHGPAVIQPVRKGDTLSLEMRTLKDKLVSLPRGKSFPVILLVPLFAGLFNGLATAAIHMSMFGVGGLWNTISMIGFGLGAFCLTSLVILGMMVIRADLLNRNDVGSESRIWLGRQDTSLAPHARAMERQLNEAACKLGLQNPGKSRYRMRIGKFMARSSHYLQAIPRRIKTGINFIPPSHAMGMAGSSGLRVLEPLKALPAPDPVTEDTKVVRLEPARR